MIPQLVELAAWVAGDHSDFFTHLIKIDPAALLRSGMAFATPDQKAKLVERLLNQAGKNKFFDESGYWSFWGDLDHPGLPQQLMAALVDTQSHLMVMVRRVSIDIAKACRRPELVPTLFDILKSQDGDRYFRSSVADALCASMPYDRLVELEARIHSTDGRNRHETPLSVMIEVEGCWNSEIKTGAKNQLLDDYLRPFHCTHGIFLVAWFHSTGCTKLAPKLTSELKVKTCSEAKTAVAAFVQPAQAVGFEISPFVLDCRLL